MGKPQQTLDGGSKLILVLGGGALAVMMAAAFLKDASSPPQADQGFARELCHGGGPVEVGDFGTLELRQAGGLKVVYTLPEWLRHRPEYQRWSLVRLEHRRDPSGPWKSWDGSRFPTTAVVMNNEGVAPWLRPSRPEDGAGLQSGEVGHVAMAAPMALSPFSGCETFYIRIAVRNETQHWNYSPSVPVTAHDIRRGAGRR